MSPHVEDPPEDLDTDSWGGHRRRGRGYIRGIIPRRPGSSYVHGRGVTGKGTQTG